MAVTQVIKTLGNVLEGMKTIIDSWLSTNITNPSNPPLDRSLSLANAAAPADLVGDLKTNIDKIDDKAPVIIESVSGDIVSFDDGAEDMPLKKCLVQIDPVQAGSGDPAPDNVRAISGWTGCNVTRTGKNLLPLKAYSGGSYNADVGRQYTLTENTSVTADDVSISYIASAWNGFTMLSDPLTPGTYHIYTKMISTNLRSSRYILDKDFVVTRKLGNTGSGTEYVINSTITLEPNECYVMIYITSSVSGSVKCEYPQIEIGSTESTYEKYSGIAYPITWQTEAGAVYGGELDVVNGILTIDKAIVDLGTLTWNTPQSENPDCFRSTSLSSLIATRNNAICSAYKVSQRPSTSSGIATEPNNTLIINKGEPGTTTGNYPIGTVLIKDSTYVEYTAEQFKTAMSGIMLVYPVVSPIIYNLTPTEIRTIFGINNIWADSGDIDVNYCADTKTYIDNKIAEIVNG